jgi:hypothetical protein
LFLPIAISDPPSPAPNDSPEVIELKRQLHWAHLKIQVLEERLRLQRIQKYGPGSEKLSCLQLELLELEPGVSQAEVQAESARDPLPPGPGGSYAPSGGARIRGGRSCRRICRAWNESWLARPSSTSAPTVASRRR